MVSRPLIVNREVSFDYSGIYMGKDSLICRNSLWTYEQQLLHMTNCGTVTLLWYRDVIVGP